MENKTPVIGITMGDPVGIGPEIILLACNEPSIFGICRPLIIGDLGVLSSAKKYVNSRLILNPVKIPEAGRFQPGSVDVLNISRLDRKHILPGSPTPETGKAMVSYITTGVQMAAEGKIAALVTCPINKSVMKLAGFTYNGHTELLAEKTRSKRFAMMLAGDRLKVVLVTIHASLKRAIELLSVEKISEVISITHEGLIRRFGIHDPFIAVAGLNPHGGEAGQFGTEEEDIIIPAIELSRKTSARIAGPFPPDTLFYHAAKGVYDAVICMYHDQGLIPFKMIHFHDGVNTTLGLPIIRTSVDHGTAYDIAGTGHADPGSLTAAIKMAAQQACHTLKR